MKRLALLAPVAALMLQACAVGLPARVSRYQALPAPAGQTFAIEPQDPEDRGGLEFGRYAELVAQRLSAEGYRPAAPGAQADLIVSLDYGVDDGRERVVSRPGFGGYGFGGYGGRFGYGGLGYGLGYGRFGYGLGYGRFGYRPFAYGWDDPFWYRPYGFTGDIRSYTEFASFLDMDIRRADGTVVFEGLARARSRDDELSELVPPLVEAMFTDFPGRSGQTLRITVPPRPERGRR